MNSGDWNSGIAGWSSLLTEEFDLKGDLLEDFSGSELESETSDVSDSRDELDSTTVSSVADGGFGVSLEDDSGVVIGSGT